MGGQIRTGPAPARSRRVVVLAAGVTLAALLAACTTGNKPGGKPGQTGRSDLPTPSDSAVAHTSSAPPDDAGPAVITAAPAGQAVNPTTPVTVQVTRGTLTAVTLVNPEGKHVTGTLSLDGTSWRSTEALGYSKTYTLTAAARSSAGATVEKTTSFTTLTPGNMTMPYLNTEYGTPIQSGATYGVGMITVVHFDEPIPDRAAAERALKVTTTPAQPGSWYWLDDQNVHWRPRAYFQPGTKVTVAAQVYGVQVGPGLFGQSDQSVSYTIGDKHVSIANGATHQVKVYFNDKLVRTMPTSMGQGGVVQGRHGPVYLWTMPGVYTVLGHENPAIMSSDSYGLPANSPYGYAPEKVYWSTKISTDGIYLHQLDTTVWAQGHQNVSHGCLNLNLQNAKWFYQTSQVGDVVQVINSGGPAIKVWQGGDWSVPWSQWLAGSALH